MICLILWAPRLWERSEKWTQPDKTQDMRFRRDGFLWRFSSRAYRLNIDSRPVHSPRAFSFAIAERAMSLIGWVKVSYKRQGMTDFIVASEHLTKAKALPRMREGLKSAGGKMRTMVRKSVHKQANTKKYGSITKRVVGVLHHGGLMAYHIRGSKKAMPIEEIKGLRVRGEVRTGTWEDQTRTRSGRFEKIEGLAKGFVSARPWGNPHRFQRSYRHATRGLVAGVGQAGLRPLYGPSIAKEVVQGETLEMFERDAGRLIEKEVAKKLARLLP